MIIYYLNIIIKIESYTWKLKGSESAVYGVKDGDPYKKELRGSFKKYVDFYHNFFSRRHST